MLKIRRRISVRFLSMVRLKSAITRLKTPSALLSLVGRDGSLPIHPRVRRRVQSFIRWWKRQKPTACGWMTICFICSAYCLSAQSRTRILRSKLCSLSQKKWSRGSRQCECWEPRLFLYWGIIERLRFKNEHKGFSYFFVRISYFIKYYIDTEAPFLYNNVRWFGKYATCDYGEKTVGWTLLCCL